MKKSDHPARLWLLSIFITPIMLLALVAILAACTPLAQCDGHRCEYVGGDAPEPDRGQIGAGSEPGDDGGRGDDGDDGDDGHDGDDGDDGDRGRDGKGKDGDDD